MCGSHNNHKNGGFCCPDPQIFQEEICGNLKGILSATRLWQVLDPIDSDYFQGTFEIFNCGNADITFVVLRTGEGATERITVTPGNTRKISVNNPIALIVNTTSASAQGKFCITLYKRVVC